MGQSQTITVVWIALAYNLQRFPHKLCLLYRLLPVGIHNGYVPHLTERLRKRLAI